VELQEMQKREEELRYIWFYFYVVEIKKLFWIY
jgi:hypothetical protein